MQELTFEQVEVVSGGSKIEDMKRQRAAREAQDRQINEDGGCGAADVAKDAYVAAGAFAGGVILGATTWGLGSYVGAFVGGMAGSLAWQASKHEVTNTLCN